MKRSKLELAAYLGDRDAAFSLGVQAAPGAESDFGEWAWQLSDWGQETMVLASLAAARFALPIWENYQPYDEMESDILGGPDVRKMLNTVDAYLAGEPESAIELTLAVIQAREMARLAHYYCCEVSGDVEEMGRRWSAVYALDAALAAVVNYQNFHHFFFAGTGSAIKN